MPQARGRGKDDARGSADSAFERVCPQARGEGGKREGGVEPPPVKTNGTSASPPPLLPLRQTVLPISSFTTKDQAHHQYEDEDDGGGWRRGEVTTHQGRPLVQNKGGSHSNVLLRVKHTNSSFHDSDGTSPMPTSSRVPA